ncbi:hypothetical protein RCJ22_21200 [Vibrio sp. FNV 38]|nr:hypothetical protein [Vibrio sp. FNV 38]
MIFTHITKAKLSLMLVGWVVLLCLTKNVGLAQAGCPLQFEARDNVVLIASDSSDASEQSGHCDLSGQLLQHQQSQLDLLVVITFIFVAAFLAWLSAQSNPIPHFTEPIDYSIRLHVRHCVFRE